ncbi:MAG: DUF1385 domain-containing protein [Dehalococcoidia bacterium]
MIRGPHTVVVACRRPDGEIVCRSETVGGTYVNFIRRIPLLRGAIVMWETLILGMRALMFSSNVALGEDEKEVTSGTVWATVIASLVLVGTLFFAGPVLLSRWLESAIENGFLVVLIEGLIRLTLVIGYIGVIGLLPDVRRVYAYHGAEHKSIHALEHGDPLEPESVQRHPTAHLRCGTSFLLTVVVVSVIVFAALGTPDLWLRLLSRIALLPVIAAISYELIRLGGAFSSNRIVRVLMWPNLALQRLTTRQPDDAQVEVALRALNEVLAAEAALATTEKNPESPALPAQTDSSSR